MAVTYEWYNAVNVQYGGLGGTLTAGTGDYIWQFAQQLVAALKAMTIAPWVTRGSSRVNNLSTSYSATPDGVDRWSTLTGTVAEHCGTGASSSVWHVLENSITGWQVCIMVKPSTAPQTNGFLEIVVAKNKFETGGAWRNAGSVTAVVRPADTTSSPAVDRELSSGQHTGSTLPPFDSLNTRYRNVVANRPDGRGFYAYSYGQSPTFSAGNLQFITLLGTAPTILHPEEAAVILNNQAVFRIMGDALTNRLNNASPDSSPSASWRINIRENDGTTKNCAGLETCQTNGTNVFSGGSGSVVDSAIGKVPIGPLSFFSNNTFIMRGSLPDIWDVSTSFSQTLETWNSLQYVKIGAFLFPWDGVTTGFGTPRNGFFWAPTGTEPTPPVVTRVGTPRGFNLGIENP